MLPSVFFVDPSDGMVRKIPPTAPDAPALQHGGSDAVGGVRSERDARALSAFPCYRPVLLTTLGLNQPLEISAALCTRSTGPVSMLIG